MDEVAGGFMELLDGECVARMEDELVLFEGLEQAVGGLEDWFELHFHINLLLFIRLLLCGLGFIGSLTFFDFDLINFIEHSYQAYIIIQTNPKVNKNYNKSKNYTNLHTTIQSLTPN